MKRIDVNCDLGESYGVYKIGNDREILKFVSSANIACGFHAGDPTVMRETVKLALHHDVAIGAHPGLQDLRGFGRRNIQISPSEAYDLVVYQIGALYGFVKAEGGTMQHVKPHGALYNMAAKDAALSKAIAEAVYAVNPELILFGLSGSELIKAGKEIGLQTANEVFADRTYQEDGSLTLRTMKGALIEEDEVAINQVIGMIEQKEVQSQQGTTVPIQADTVCIHGDGTHALQFAHALNTAFKQADITRVAVSCR
ncbi:LamB/YcsF family protein [Priestia flexa]|jgi:5-oxoprolinase (ATP-hydrolysing) subunit A|uniref:5-oxoprolinase subunit A n=1 Tax=Priestia flexa TaxID=86664 RepID=A0A8I1MEC7_9BACI|nr:5-oxoprolinase subunit PxpA [Priestia flexa]MBN8251291.1 LamB/YcsF family protein [Priestia flexa]MBN8434446.1 LamB/YcsF family protein [Priestia flexa]MCA0966769.1 LamB/YcsF family protein [Priestia flexa]QCS53135.1 LamB/YcsF family protein [Priestia flexa]UIR31802.1 LamB/YcsF family protein [Priestia flexa]